MDYDTTKVDEVVLALLHLNAYTGSGITRAWKGFDWDALDRLHSKGLIENPANKAKSVVLSEVGLQRAKELFRKLFARSA